MYGGFKGTWRNILRWLLRTHALAITCERDSYYVRTRSVLRTHVRGNGPMNNGISVNGIASVS